MARMLKLEEVNQFCWDNKEVIFDDLSQMEYNIVDLGSSGYRINPCPHCGHCDCCTINENYEGVAMGKCFSCDETFNFVSLLKQVNSSKGLNFENRIFNLLGIKILRNLKVDEKEIRKHEIHLIAADYYNSKLFSSSNALDYETKTRGVTEELLVEYKVGFVNGKGKLKILLKEKGFTEEEIQLSKVLSIPEGLIVFPYFHHGIIIRFNTKKPLY